MFPFNSNNCISSVKKWSSQDEGNFTVFFHFENNEIGRKSEFTNFNEHILNAFLNGDLSETVYMHQPPGFVDNRYPHHVCLLQRSLYGLKQAPRAWFQRGSQVAYLLIYVDDIILTASCPALLQQIIGSLNNEFDMTDLGALNYFLGISADRTPTESKLGPEGAPVQDPTLYRSLAGGLQYLTFTRPDLSYAVQQICLYMHVPREPHLAALKRILRYVQGTLDLGLHLYSSSTTSLVITYYLAETAWLRNLLRELHSPLSTATLVYCDNVSAGYMLSNPVQPQRTKHVEIEHSIRPEIWIPLVVVGWLLIQVHE
ncbi:ribonuclease H-like domain-containing protein [Tanacetum coccineum]